LVSLVSRIPAAAASIVVGIKERVKMRDEKKTKRQLIDELSELRRRIAELEASEARRGEATEYIDIAGVVIAAIAADQRITFINRKGCDILGYEVKEILGKNWFDIFVPQRIRDETEVAFDKLMAGEIESIDYVEDCVLTKSGEERTIAWHNTLTRDEEGNITGVLDSGVDITERKQAEETLRNSEERYRLLAENVTDVISLTAMNQKPVYVSPSITRQRGYTPEEAMVQTPEERMTPESIELANKVLAEELAIENMESKDLRRSRTLELEMKCKGGSTIWTETEVTFRRDPDGQALGILGVMRDITEHKQAEEALRDSEERYRSLSITDELTGLHNRRHFYAMLENEINRTRRYGRSFCVVMLDLDWFKEYNDKFGHINGDAVLKSFAQTLESALRKADMAFRYGGDEFTVILPATDANRARKIVERIRARWLEMPKLQNHRLLESPLGFSAGIAQFPENTESADGLVFLADTALYHAKARGGHSTRLAADLEALPANALIPTMLDQVYALAATVDARDPHTYGHSQRVAVIAETLGKAVGLSQRELADLHAAALLHDIGKVGIRDSILIKSTALAESERREMEAHCLEGARIVSYIRELAGLVPLIRHHHEWYDGTGYPHGLEGEEIPVGASILAVADAYDTMTTPRPYRETISHQEALKELKRCAGTQFDPELVQVFCRAVNQSTEQG